jgi:hypothetical protein
LRRRQRRQALQCRRVEERGRAVREFRQHDLTVGPAFDRELCGRLTIGVAKSAERADRGGIDGLRRAGADQMLAADLLNGKEREEESADDPKQDLHAQQEREPFVDERRQARQVHGPLPLAPFTSLYGEANDAVHVMALA